MKVQFLGETTTDQKRLVRGEVYQYAKTLLQQRDGKSQGKWNIFMLAGGSPGEEIGVCRGLFQRACITSCDVNSDLVELALSAGADRGLVVELQEGCVVEGAPFDFAFVDLCETATAKSEKLLFYLLRKSSGFLADGGVLAFAFSYGRDVGAIYEPYREHLGRYFHDSDFSETLQLRISFMLGQHKTVETQLLHLISYMGSNPMCVMIFGRAAAYHKKVGQLRIGTGDYEIALTETLEPSVLYATPQDRIESLRRSHAAIKAHYTRKQKVSKSQFAIVRKEAPVPRLEHLQKEHFEELGTNTVTVRVTGAREPLPNPDYTLILDFEDLGLLTFGGAESATLTDEQQRRMGQMLGTPEFEFWLGAEVTFGLGTDGALKLLKASLPGLYERMQKFYSGAGTGE
jgi:hypothetical protein